MLLSNCLLFFVEEMYLFGFITSVIYIVILINDVEKGKRRPIKVFSVVVNAALLLSSIILLLGLLILTLAPPLRNKEKIPNQNGNKSIVILSTESTTVSSILYSYEFDLIKNNVYLRRKLGSNGTGQLFDKHKQWENREIKWIDDKHFEIYGIRFNILGKQIE